MALRGVNVGGWLVLEKWMKPALFAGTEAGDEYSLGEALGPAETEKRLRQHREQFITAADFKWMRDHGLNAVRIPIGYWLLNPEPPFVGGSEMLDAALDWCDEYGLAANIDFHGLPGFQGPEHHSGRMGLFMWDKEETYLKRSLDFVEQVAQTYRTRKCINMISLVNEPGVKVSAEFLLKFYEQGCERVRKHMSEKVAVTIAAFTESRLPELHRKINGANIKTDIHPYPCFRTWQAGQLADFVAAPVVRDLPLQRSHGQDDLIIGEWSLGVGKNVAAELQAKSKAEQDLHMRTFAGNQLITYEQTFGWYFWSYRIEQPENPPLQHAWSYRDAVELGWLPGTW